MEFGFVALIIFIYLVTRGQSVVIKGKFGELKVNFLLQKHLASSIYQILNDVTVPSVNGTTQIDHVIVSHYGIFVIETKNYKGWIFGNARDAEWTVTNYGKKSRFQNPIRQNYAHLKALEAITGLTESVFHSIVVFVGQAQIKTSVPDEVCYLSGLVDGIKLKGRQLLSSEQVIAAVHAIRAGRLEPGFRTNRAHVSALNERFGDTLKQGAVKGVSQELKKVAVEGAIKLVAVIIGIIIIIQAMGHIQGAISDLIAPKSQPVSRQVIPPQPATRKRQQSITTYRKQSEPRYTQQPSVKTEAKQREWELTLRCGYSIDTNRCACYDRKGVKATVESKRCKVLATGE